MCIEKRLSDPSILYIWLSFSGQGGGGEHGGGLNVRGGRYGGGRPLRLETLMNEK